LFAVSKHHKENFYLSPSSTGFVTRENNPNFDNEVKTAKQLSKALTDPVAALKAEDKQDRYTAAAILITRYRSNPTGAPMKSEPIKAEESKLILQALAGGDWTIGRFDPKMPNPYTLFSQLGVTAKDGYNPTPARNQQDIATQMQNIATQMQKWLDENSGKYIIQKLVPDENAKVQPGVNDPVVPGVRPGIKLNPKAIKNIKVLPIKGAVPAPAPRPAPRPVAPPQIDPPQDLPLPVPPRRDD
jgi:hypothetical protein